MAGNMLSASKMLRQRLSSKKPRNKKRNYFTNAAEKKKIHQAKFLFAENWMGRMSNSFWICRLAVFVNIIYRFIFEPYIYCF